MGACYHMEGVQCDNCRTGLSSGAFHPFPDVQIAPATVTPPLGRYVTLEGMTMDTLDLPASKREVEELRAELDALKARLDPPAASEPVGPLYLYQIGPLGCFKDYYVVLVVAESEDAARRIHPDAANRWDEELQTWRWGWNETHRVWTTEPKKPFIGFDTPIHKLTVRRLGVAAPGLSRGTVLCAAPMADD